MREEEDRLLNKAGWVNRQQGAVRVPVDVAMDVIARRGVDPGVVGGRTGRRRRRRRPGRRRTMARPRRQRRATRSNRCNR